jgi:hypothetical protein
MKNFLGGQGNTDLRDRIDGFVSVLLCHRLFLRWQFVCVPAQMEFAPLKELLILEQPGTEFKFAHSPRNTTRLHLLKVF